MMITLFNQIGEREKATKKGKIRGISKAVTVHKTTRGEKEEGRKTTKERQFRCRTDQLS